MFPVRVQVEFTNTPVTIDQCAVLLNEVRLNLVERFFGMLTEKQIRHGVFTSVGYLEEYLKNYLNTYNENPRPLVWDKVG